MDIKNRAESYESKHIDNFDNNFLQMPFGKYAGTLIKDLPDNYLTWVSENWGEDSNFESDNNTRIRQAAEDEMDYRYLNGIYIIDECV